MLVYIEPRFRSNPDISHLFAKHQQLAYIGEKLYASFEVYEISSKSCMSVIINITTTFMLF